MSEGGSDAARRAAEAVRAQYQAGDVVAAGAWTLESPAGVFVMVDLQSTVPGLVQARADLWLVDSSGARRLARSDVMQAAAEIGAYTFEDLTGDGLPDLLGYVADSAGTSYPIFLAGAVGSMSDEIVAAAPGWRFAVDDSLPRVYVGPFGPCAVQLWAEDDAPDGLGANWRYLAFVRGGSLGPPRVQRPEC